MKMNFASSAIAIAAVITAVPAFAQEQEQSTESAQSGLGEIVVTARRVAESLQEVPVSITVLSGDDLVAQNIRTPTDFVTSTPNLQLQQGAGQPSTLVLSIRGQVQTDVLSTLDASIGIYVDGVNYARADGVSGGLLDIQRVEILKGPQGTLFGRNTTGGAFNITTNDVDLNDRSLSMRFSAGNYGRLDKTAVVNLPIIEDKIGLRVAGQHLYSSGYGRDLTSGRRLSGDDNYTVRAKLRIKPSDNFDVTLAYEHFNMDQPGSVIRIAYLTPNAQPVAGLPGLIVPSTPELEAIFEGGTGACFDFGVLVSAPTFSCPGGTTYVAGPRSVATFIGQDPYASFNNVFPTVLAKTDTASLTAAYDTSIGTLKYIGAYRKVSASTPIDLDGTPYTILQTRVSRSTEQWTHELQFSGQTDNGFLDYTFGAFAFDEHGSDGSTSTALVALQPVSANPNGTFGLVDNKSRAAYAQFTVHPTDALSVTGGIRYSKDTKVLDSRTTGGTPTVCRVPVALRNNPDVACSAIFRRKDSGISYTGSINYKITDDVLAYVKTSKGFRAGGQNLRGVDAQSLSSFKPETVTDYEVGIKSEFLDRRVRLNVAAFTSKYRNIQKSTLQPQLDINGDVIPGSTSTVVSNAAGARIKGGEVELTVLPVDGLRLSGTLGITDAKYNSFPATCVTITGVVPCDRSGENFAYVPETTWSLSGQYTLPTNFGAVSARLDYRHTSAITFVGVIATNSPALVPFLTQSGYGVLGGRLSADIDSLNATVSLFGTNLLDKRYDIGGLDLTSLGYITRQAGPPRQYGLEVGFEF